MYDNRLLFAPKLEYTHIGGASHDGRESLNRSAGIKSDVAVKGFRRMMTQQKAPRRMEQAFAQEKHA